MRIIERSSGAVVREVRNDTGSSDDLVAEVQANLDEFSVDEFEGTWGIRRL